MYDDFQKLRRGVVNVRFPRAKRLKTKRCHEYVGTYKKYQNDLKKCCYLSLE